MSSKFDAIFSAMEENMKTAKGEIYKFQNDNKKKAATAARAALLNIRKTCTEARNELQKLKAALPVRRRNISEETKKRMADARAQRKAAKEAKKAK